MASLLGVKLINKYGLLLQIKSWIITKIKGRMTVDYVTNNACILAVNKAWGGVNLEGNRKGLYTELFFMFFIYFISQVLHAFKYKNSTMSRRSVQHSLIPARISELNAQNQEGKDDKEDKPELPWHEKRWNRNFSFMFSAHSVALGMVILFSPLAGALVMAYIHLLLFFIYSFCEFKTMIMPCKLVKVLMDLTNISLMIIGAAGINYAQYCKNGAGNLVCCREL